MGKDRGMFTEPNICADYLVSSCKLSTTSAASLTNVPSVSMPELVAQTNMDLQAVNRLREELAKMTQWLGKNSKEYFTSEYESASQDYIEKARGV